MAFSLLQQNFLADRLNHHILWDCCYNSIPSRRSKSDLSPLRYLEGNIGGSLRLKPLGYDSGRSNDEAVPTITTEQAFTDGSNAGKILPNPWPSQVKTTSSLLKV